MAGVTLLLAILLTAYCNVAAVTYYVKPSIDTGDCPGEPCLPLANYTADPDNFFISGARFVFLRGEHELKTNGLVVIRDRVNLSLVGDNQPTIQYSSEGFLNYLNASVTISCQNSSSGFSFINVTALTIQNLQFQFCGGYISTDLVQEALFVQTKSSVLLVEDTRCTLFLVNIHSLTLEAVGVYESKGYGLLGINVIGTAVIDKSFFWKNNQFTYFERTCYRSPISGIINTDCVGGNALLAFTDPPQCPSSLQNYTISIHLSSFQEGVDLQGGFMPSSFLSQGTGLGLLFAQTTFGVHVLLNHTIFYGNIGRTGANLFISSFNYAQNGTVLINNCAILNGNAAPGYPWPYNYHLLLGEGLAFIHSRPNIFSSRLACPNLQYSGEVTLEILAIYNTTFAQNGHMGLGSAMLLDIQMHNYRNLKRTITMDSLRVIDNIGLAGMGMALINIQLLQPLDVIISNSVFSDNIPTKAPQEELAKELRLGKMYQLSQLQFGTIMFFAAKNVTIKNCTFANNGLTAIASIRSFFTFEGTMVFYNNTGVNGGAMSFLGDSIMYLQDNLTMIFKQNTAAQRGGAIYVIEEFVVDVFCFFQFGSLLGERVKRNVTMFFIDNSALEAGDVLYGGLLEICVVYNPTIDSGETFKKVSVFQHEDTESAISSDPELCCFCVNEKPDCDVQNSSVSVFPGESFQVSIVAVGQLLGTVPAVVRAHIEPPTSAKFDSFQVLQKTQRYCGNLAYTISTHNNTETVVFFPDGVFPSVISPHLIVHLLPCPLGFQLVKGKCGCSQLLQERKSLCDIEHETITRKPPYWFSTATGDFAYHDHCPFDYCRDQEVVMHLDDPDKQCAFNHSGLLCGGCKDGLSLTLASSKCKNCSNIYLLLIIPFAIMGILLVVTLSVLNLTVRVGTIHGLIFYANIVKINQAVFFPKGEINFFTVFISWLNLDFGIQSCFFDGLDAYSNTWLQFAFPLYLWGIGIAIIVSARYSARVSEKFNNAVHVLDTLFLLLYTKILRVIITALSFTVIRYQDEPSRVVWLYDGNIEYGEAKHIPLIVFAALFFFFALPYTFILLFVQHLRRFSHKRAFKWVEKIKPFMDAYTGPYRSSHSYWTGLLLLARVLLVLVFTVNILGDPAIDMLVGSSVACLLIVLVRGVYKSKFLDVLETSFLVNLAILSIGTCYIGEAGGNQLLLSSISVSVACVEFIGIVGYHMFLYLKNYHGIKLPELLNIQCFMPCCHLYRHVPLPVDGDVSSDESEEHRDSLVHLGAEGLFDEEHLDSLVRPGAEGLFDEIPEAQIAVPTTHIDIRHNQ